MVGLLASIAIRLAPLIIRPKLEKSAAILYED